MRRYAVGVVDRWDVVLGNLSPQERENMRNRPSYIASHGERREPFFITPKIQERRRSREGSNDLSVVWGPCREKPWRRSGATPPSKLAPLANRLQTLPLARRAVPRRLQIVADSPPPRKKRCSVRCKS